MRIVLTLLTHLTLLFSSLTKMCPFYVSHWFFIPFLNVFSMTLPRSTLPARIARFTDPAIIEYKNTC